jgi:hypothetical protein
MLAYYAYASNNTPQNLTFNETLAYDYQQNTLFNTPGIPDQGAWETYEKKRQAALAINRREAAANGLPARIRCSCVEYAQWYLGINLPPMGVASKWPVNSSQPVIGGVVVLSGGSAGHVAVILDFTAINLFVTEGNVPTCSTGNRTISRSDTNIIGYWNPTLWHLTDTTSTNTTLQATNTSSP